MKQGHNAMTRVTFAMVSAVLLYGILGCCTTSAAEGKRDLIQTRYAMCASQADRARNPFQGYRCWTEAQALCIDASLEKDCGDLRGSRWER